MAKNHKNTAPPGRKIIRTLSHPNSLTLYRVVAIPVVVILLLFPSRGFTLLAALVFTMAAITDFLDGFLAKRYGLVSNFGRIMDPVADKLLVSSSLIMLSSHGWVAAWMVCIIVGREFAVTGLRNIIAEKGKDVSASLLGKYKTGFQIVAIIFLLIHFQYFGIDFHAIGTVLLWIALILTVWSGIDYFVRFRRLFLP